LGLKVGEAGDGFDLVGVALRDVMIVIVTTDADETKDLPFEGNDLMIGRISRATSGT
jgi:hypothetical protein